MNAGRSLKTYTLLIFVILATGVLGATAAGSTFPRLHGSVALAIGIVLVGQITPLPPRQRFHWTLGMTVAIGVIYRGVLVMLPATVPGNDPEKYALLAQLTLQSGTSAIPRVRFYSLAGAYHTFIAETAAILGLPTETAIAVIAILLGVGMPLFAAAIALALCGRGRTGYRAAAIASIIAAVMTMSVRFGYSPIAQSIGIVLFVAAIFLLLKQRTWHPYQSIIAVGVVVGALTFTHKLVVVALCGVVAVIWTVGHVVSHPRVAIAERQHISPVFIAALGVAALTQNAVLTEQIQTVVALVLSTLSAGQSVARGGGTPAAATSPDPGLLWPFFSHSHMIVVLAIGGLAWLGVTIYYVRRADRIPPAPVTVLVTIATVVAVVVITIGGVVSTSAVQPVRIYALVEPLLAALIGVGVAIGLARTHQPAWGRVGAVALVGLLVVVAVFSSTAAPAYPAEPRSYLTDSELSGKEFTADHMSRTVATDDKLARETENRNTVVSADDPRIRLGAAPDDQFSSRNPALVEGTLVREEPPALLLRPNVRIYRIGGEYNDYRYELSWNPERAANGEFNRAYDSGGAVLYQNPDSE